MYSFALVTSLTIVGIIIFGFDISTPEGGTRKALSNTIKNSGQVAYFYEINDKFAFSVFTDREPGDYDVGVTVYEQNVVPFCFTCGWYTNDLDDDRGMMMPSRQGSLIYSTDPDMSFDPDAPEGGFVTLDLESGVYGYVNDLSEISADAADPKYQLDRVYISENYDEISFSSYDDEDCFIFFGAMFLCYIILIIWGLIALIVRRKKA